MDREWIGFGILTIALAFGMFHVATWFLLVMRSRSKRLSPGAPTASEFAGSLFSLFAIVSFVAVVVLAAIWLYWSAFARQAA